MFDKIVDQVLTKLQKSIATGQGQWSYFEITQESSDESVRRIFRLRYEDLFKLEAERILKAPEDSMMPYDSDAVKKSVARLVDDLKKNFIIPRSDIEKIMRDTLFTRLRYLVQPLATIEGLLFEDASARSVADIVAKFRDFEKFRYYPDALEKYAHAKGINHLTRGQLAILITEINQSLFGGDHLDNVLKLCGLIMKEINDIQGKTANTIDTELLMKAFQDRSLRDYEVALNIEKELGSEQINIYGLRQVLNRFNILKQKKAVPVPPRIDKAPEIVPAEPKTDTTDAVIENVLAEDSAEVIDINKILTEKPKKDATDQLQVRSADHQSKEPVKTPVIKSPSDVTGEFSEDELTAGFSDDTAAIKLTALKESDNLVLLQSLINAKDEKILVASIFKTDGEAYQDFINSINRTKTWKEAIAITDDRLASLGVDPYSKEAIRLSDIVYARYYPPELAE